MKIVTFAAINIGSYEIEMKIFELSNRFGIREIDHIRHHVELGKDTFVTGRLSKELVDEVCYVLKDFKRILEEYKAGVCRVCATSGLREARNLLTILDQVKIRTGFDIEVLSNSEQRFLGYKSIASSEADFNRIIQKATAIVDVGGGSVQVSVFDKDKLVTTQNLKIGAMRIREKLADLETKTIHHAAIVEEFINHQIYTLRSLFLKEREIKNLIVVGDFIEPIMKLLDNNSQHATKEQFIQFYDSYFLKTDQEIADQLGIGQEEISLFTPSLILYKRFIEAIGVEEIWCPGIDLNDGVAYDYAERNRIIKSLHDFDKDIVAAAKNIAKRYQSNKVHCAIVNSIAGNIFDSTKKIHGLGKRERLLLEIAVLLHDCGKYISLTRTGECSYNIIMSTEIIGLSHREREVVANIVKFNNSEFDYYEERYQTNLNEPDYLLVAKLTAILRVANSLERTHKQKFSMVKAALRDKELVITIDTVEDITLEEGLFEDKADFFEEVLSIRPVIKRKKRLA